MQLMAIKRVFSAIWRPGQILKQRKEKKESLIIIILNQTLMIPSSKTKECNGLFDLVVQKPFWDELVAIRPEVFLIAKYCPIKYMTLTQIILSQRKKVYQSTEMT